MRVDSPIKRFVCSACNKEEILDMNVDKRAFYDTIQCSVCGALSKENPHDPTAGPINLADMKENLPVIHM